MSEGYDVFSSFRNFDDFDRFFKAQVKSVSILSQVPIEYDRECLLIVHKSWLDRREFWLKEKMAKGTTRLSHLKECAILIDCCATIDLCRFPISQEQLEAIKGDKGFSNSSYDAERIDLMKKHGSTYICWMIFFGLCESYQRNRPSSRNMPLSRITPEIEMNMLALLKGKDVNDFGLYLMLTAVFLK